MLTWRQTTPPRECTANEERWMDWVGNQPTRSREIVCKANLQFPAQQSASTTTRNNKQPISRQLRAPATDE
ncbi:hypothetical protein O181_036709 [Austropuccinia psidii MF-1]|uniref:Uncharacterized protein n=1 Tax=Austropuccinia psidii MF-1 TaxID=1389203 RepID=A0A9Q3D563_9BASI|nr:hypothetical protein [Austropuccinia psidii MF-1]